ncbi:MAG: prepilin-type N-terminal cleavage/methylation domain-containing protein [Candidatus Yonathbacteria bacterium]|nr:prepilin-type N-terminal cleavage/methylation domain-containing protein [Candidatus Yonathbacteria bacterium]
MKYKISEKRKEKKNFPCPIPNSTRSGFTLLELLIVIAILAIIIASVLPSLINFSRSSLLNTETQEAVTLINRARLLSVSSKNDNRFGVHFEAGKLVLFQGAIYTTGVSTNEEHVFDTRLTSTTTINGGGSEVLFAKVTGSTSQNATTTLFVVGTTASTTILIRQTGVATIY